MTKSETETETETKWTRARIGKAVLLGVVGIAALVLAIRLPGVWLPVVFALLMAYILEPVISFMHRHRMPRGVTVSMVYALFLLLLAGVGVMVVPTLIEQGRNLVQYVKEKSDEYGVTGEFLHSEQGAAEKKENSGSWWANLFQEEEPPGESREASSESTKGESPTEGDPQGAGGLPRRVGSWVKSNSTMLKERIPMLFAGGARTIVNGAGSVAGTFIQVVLALFYAFFFMLHFPAFPAAVTRWIPPRHRREAAELGREIDDVVAGFFRGRLLVCLISSVVASIGLLISGIDFWLLLGLAAGFLGIIPFIGITLTLIPALLVAFASEQTVFAVVGVLVTFGIVQWIIEPFVGPFVISGKVRMHPVTVTVAFMAGGALFGVLGLLLAIPACGILKILARRYLAPAVTEVWRGAGSTA